MICLSLVCDKLDQLKSNDEDRKADFLLQLNFWPLFFTYHLHVYYFSQLKCPKLPSSVSSPLED